MNPEPLRFSTMRLCPWPIFCLALLLQPARPALAAPAPSRDRAASGAEGSAKWGRGFARRLELFPDEPVATWFYFSDRAGSERDPAAYQVARQVLSSRTLERRARRGTLDDLVASD